MTAGALTREKHVIFHPHSVLSINGDLHISQ